MGRKKLTRADHEKMIEPLVAIDKALCELWEAYRHTPLNDPAYRELRKVAARFTGLRQIIDEDSYRSLFDHEHGPEKPRTNMLTGCGHTFTAFGD